MSIAMPEAPTAPVAPAEIPVEELVEILAPYEETDDPNAKAHIINPAMNGHVQNGVYMSAKEIVATARMRGQEVVALCGYRWVPKHNPDKYDACKICVKHAGDLMREAGE